MADPAKISVVFKNFTNLPDRKNMTSTERRIAGSTTFKELDDALTFLEVFKGQINTVTIEVNANTELAKTYKDDTNAIKTDVLELKSDVLVTKSEIEAMVATAETYAQAVVNVPESATSSTTELTVSTGQKILTVGTGKSFLPKMWVVICDDADPAFAWMVGWIDSYDSGAGALVVNVTGINNEGHTGSSWLINISTPTITGGGGAKRLNKLDNYTVKAGELNGLNTFTNLGAVKDIELLMPAGEEGLKGLFVIAASHYLKVSADGSEKIRYPGSSDQVAYVRSNVPDTLFNIEFINGGWLITSLTGTLKGDE